jgi:hypothetical protein
MKNRTVFKFFTLIVIGCISTNLFAAEFNYNRMDLSTPVISKILPLENLCIFQSESSTCP